MTAAFYGFQRAPDVRFVIPKTGWSGWFDAWAKPLLDLGHSIHHLHNPFGLYDIRDRKMHIDQFFLAYCQGLDWLANAEAFAEAVDRVHQRGGTVQAYVGSPLVIPKFLHPANIPQCPPGDRWIELRRRIGSMLALCRIPGLFFSCLCWTRLVSIYINVLVKARVDAIGFDDSADFHPGDCMDRLVRRLISERFEVMIEPWPRRGRNYPPVSWIIREVLFQQIRLGRLDQHAPLETVVGKIYRIIPSDQSNNGQDEIAEINALLPQGEPPFTTTRQWIDDRVIPAGHFPLARAQQLNDGSVP